MANIMNDLLDSQISMNRLIWIMDDVTYNKLLSITQSHLRLVKEALDTNTTVERRNEITQLIEDLRSERDNIISEFSKTITNKGEN